MGPLLAIGGAAVIGAAITYGASIWTSYSHTLQEMDRYRQADTVVQKANDINAVINVDSYMGGVNRNRLESAKLMRTKPFSAMVADTGGVRTETINKYATAAKEVLEANPNAADSFFTCSRLQTTGHITLQECEEAKAAQLSFFSLEGGAIRYTVEQDKASRIENIENARQTNLDRSSVADGDRTTTSRSLRLGEKVFTKEMKFLAQKEQEAENYIAQGRYDVANAVLADIEESGIRSDKLALLRTEIVVAQLVKEGNVVLEAGEVQARMINQNIEQLPQAIKNTVVQTIAKTNENGILKYETHEESKILLEKIAQEMVQHPAKYAALPERERQKFTELIQKLR